jgi:hypothetical protein
MNAFTQKPDLSNWVKKQKQSNHAQRGGVRRSQMLDGQVLPGNERNHAKTRIHPKGKP